jgi:phage-related protein
LGARSVLINLLGDGGGATRALRGVGDEADRAARRVDDLDASNRRASEGGNVFARSLESIAPAAGRAAASIGMVAAQAGAAIPVAAGLGAAVVAIAPAAAVAVTALAAVGIASTALKVGMSGVSEAVSAAMNPADPAAYAEALAKLSPNARAFVGEIRQLQPALAGIKTAVQDGLFEGLDKSFAGAAQTTLPLFRKGLVDAADALNAMGKNALDTIKGLGGKGGPLSQLLDGATGGLKNLSTIPAGIIKGLVQIGAAAAPTFQRLTKAGGAAFDKLSASLSKAFESGAMTKAIDVAVGLLKELAGVAKNVITIVSNIFGAAQVSGGGFVGVLKEITGALAQVTGNPAFQQGLQAIFAVMNQLATTAGPLLAQALLAIAPVFAALGPPVQVLIQALGAALQPIIAALGPVLLAAAQAVGALVVALAPLLPVIGQVIAALLPVLVPVLQLMTTVLTALTPVIAIVAQALTTYLVPVITAVVGVVTTVVNWFRQLAEQVFPAVAGAVTTTSGPLAGLKQALSDLWAAVQPLAAAMWDLVQRVFVAIAPALAPVLLAVAEVGKAMVDVLAWAITNIVVPAINGLTSLLSGDAAVAIQGYSATVSEATNSIVESIQSLSARTVPVIAQWAIRFGLAVNGIADAVKDAFADMYADVQQLMIKFGLMLPGALRAAVGTMRAAAGAIGKAVVAVLNVVAPELVWAVQNWVKGMVGILRATVPTMVSIGKSIITGLVAGVNSAAAGLFSRLADIAGKVKSIFSGVLQTNSPSRVMIGVGEDVMDGLSVGVETGWKGTKGVLTRVAGDLADVLVRAGGDLASFGKASGDFAIINIGAKLAKALTGTVDQINEATKTIAAKIRDAFKAKNITAGERDGLLDYLATTNKKLKDLSKEREKILDKIKEIQDYAKQLTQSVLNYAAITNIKGDEGAAPNGGQLVAGLQARLATIREFGGNLKKLAAAGLSKALLGQILDAGIDGGAAIAAELANGPASIIAALNTAQTQITKIAKGIGIDGADALFGSGKAMGDAFLKGLKSLEKALVDSMEELVEKLVKALGNGVDKAKNKLTEMVGVSQEIAQLANASGDVVMPKAKAPAPKAPAPQAPKAAPVYQYIAPPKSGSGNKTVSVNMGGVTVRDRADVDMLMNAASFKVRGATF